MKKQVHGEGLSSRIKTSLLLLVTACVPAFGVMFYYQSNVDGHNSVDREDMQLLQELKSDDKGASKFEKELEGIDAYYLSSDSFIQYSFDQIKQQPKTKEALALLDKKPFDLLTASVLVAQGIPECKRLDREEIRAWFLDVASMIRKAVLHHRKTEFGIDYLQKNGPADFLIMCADMEIGGRRGIQYVANDAVDHGNPNHIFPHGVALTGRGCCANLPIVWKIVGDMLQWPIEVRIVPHHCYIAWHDDKNEFNIEVTNRAQKFPDEHYMSNADVTQKEKDSGQFMSDRTDAQLLSDLFLQRASYWVVKKEWKKAFEDNLLALSLDSNSSLAMHNVRYCLVKYIEDCAEIHLTNKVDELLIKMDNEMMPLSSFDEITVAANRWNEAQRAYLKKAKAYKELHPETVPK